VFFPADTAADSLRLVADSLGRAGGDGEAVAAALAAADSLEHQALLHRTFAVEAYGDTVWVGTAGGICRSFDGGATWQTDRVRLDAADRPLPGHVSANWVVAVERQALSDGSSAVWAGTRVSQGEGQVDGFSVTRDQGVTWQFSWPASGPTFAWDYGFDADTVWAATERALYSSADGGARWDSVAVADPFTGVRLRGAFVGVETVAAAGEASLWVGADNGLARSVDGGRSWTVLSFPLKTPSLDGGEVIGEGGLIDADSVATYAAPTPFSPSRDEACRIVYSLSRDAEVTIEIYDFASRPVRTLLRSEPRAGQRNHGEHWDGTDADGQVVANGVYFYRLELDGGARAFGKLVVLE
ncbi:MAG: hypothetical protein ABIL09_02880, partial [Gemmatimonadota bacterium]